MRSNWTQCPKGDVQSQFAVDFFVSLNRSGHLMMNKRTWQKLGEPPAFQLFFDNTNSRIGVKASALAGKHAYAVRKNGGSGGKMVNAYRLLVEFKIDLPHTVEFQNAETDDDGILVLDLRTAKASKRSQNNWARKKKENIRIIDE